MVSFQIMSVGILPVTFEESEGGYPVSLLHELLWVQSLLQFVLNQKNQT